MRLKQRSDREDDAQPGWNRENGSGADIFAMTDFHAMVFSLWKQTAAARAKNTLMRAAKRNGLFAETVIRCH